MLLTGCGSGGPDLVPVSGQIMLNSGPWPASGALHFIPVGVVQGSPSRAGMAEFGPDGKFVAKTFPPQIGLLPGSYQVRVECWKVPPTMEAPIGDSYVPHKYQNPKTSGLQVAVKLNEPIHDVSFNISTEGS
jgi:hypothetical protein